MEKKTVYQEITDLLEVRDDWMLGGVIDDLVRSEMGAKASNVGRRCRELCNSGVLARDLIQIDAKGPWVVRYKFIKVKDRSE